MWSLQQKKEENKNKTLFFLFWGMTNVSTKQWLCCAETSSALRRFILFIFLIPLWGNSKSFKKKTWHLLRESSYVHSLLCNLTAGCRHFENNASLWSPCVLHCSQNKHKHIEAPLLTECSVGSVLSRLKGANLRSALQLLPCFFFFVFFTAFLLWLRQEYFLTH